MDNKWFDHPLSIFIAELRQDEYKIPLSADLSVLRDPIEILGKRAYNRIAVQPMEGCDGTADGTPTELTHRRYLRFADGGAGMIWLEATAISPESRANPRQLMLTGRNLDDYCRLVDAVRKRAIRAHANAPLLVLQAAHSGRYSKLDNRSEPLIAYHCETLDKFGTAHNAHILGDDELSALPEQFAVMAHLAEKAGFDAIDVKACHRYLLSELLSAYTRQGQFGGSYENRVRLLLDSVRAVKAYTKQLLVTCRLNIYDGYTWPHGWGVSEGGGITPDLTEPIQLVKDLFDLGVPLINLTFGNPYFNPHVNRPYDHGGYPPTEHPLRGVERACSLTGQVKRAVPEMKIVASALSYMRSFAGNTAAGMIQSEYADFAGFGRMAFAYPNFANRILQGKKLDSQKICLTCSKCTELMRMGSETGCVARDELYTKLYREAKKQ